MSTPFRPTLRVILGLAFLSLACSRGAAAEPAIASAAVQVIRLDGRAGGPRFDGIGAVNGGGATAVLLKDYPEPQRSEILDLVFKPKFGASISALLVEVPGDGNSTQGSMPSHMHARGDLNYDRGYIWWILREAQRRNPDLTLDAAAWSAPGWIGHGDFWSQDAADYYVKWLQGLRDRYGLALDALGCRNERGVSFSFAKQLRATLDANGFTAVKVHAFDNWPEDKLDFVPAMAKDESLRNAIDIIGAHTFWEGKPASAEVQRLAASMHKPIWNTEEHVYLKGFNDAISLVQACNLNFIRSGATKVVFWYDIAALYPIEPYAEDPPMILAYSPWSGNYRIREKLWAYAHYGQFSAVGWQYLNGACGELGDGGSYVTLKSPGNDYSIIVETKDAKASQQVRFEIGGGLSAAELCVWRSNADGMFLPQPPVQPGNGVVTTTLDPGTIYSFSTTRGQQKGAFGDAPATKPFPFPYRDTFDGYASPRTYGYLPRYTADIAGAFELADRPDGKGQCLHQAAPIPTTSWAPDWLPYTIIGDDQWSDYEVSADVWLTPGDAAAVMGRLNNVGTGWGFYPKGYYLSLGDDGQCRLVVVRGNPEKKKPAGDAEQQALIKAGQDDSAGGEKVLATSSLPDVHAGQWHNLTIRFTGSTIVGLVDGKEVVRANDTLYHHGMAGLLAGARADGRLSTPYFDDLRINAPGGAAPEPTGPLPGQAPIY